MKEKIDVTIACITYNHINFIEKALEGFLMQKTDFTYEIIIHDDASKDGTREVLTEYQKKYPDKITLLLEEENQFSKGIRIMQTFVFPKARGKYVALCEGDDEWIYDKKLQRQYDFMENHKDTALCVHNAIRINEQSKEKILQMQEIESGYMDDEEIVLSRKGKLPTASYFFRSEYIKDIPGINETAPVGDEPIRLYCACRGGIYYMDKVWSVRNYMHEGSWNASIRDNHVFLEYAKKYIKYLCGFNIYSGYRFQPYIEEYLHYYGKTMILREMEGSFDSKVLRETVENSENMTEHVIDNMFNRVYVELMRSCGDYLDKACEFIEEAKSQEGRFFLYGAGKIAAENAYILQEKGISFEGFIVSDASRNENFYMGHRVYDVKALMEHKDKIYLWLSMNDDNIAEVLVLLEKIGFENIF